MSLHIHRIDQDEQAVTLEFYAMPDTLDDYAGFGFSLHLVDQITGRSVAGINELATRDYPLSHSALYANHISGSI